MVTGVRNDAPPSSGGSQKLCKAAADFEALLIAQLLKGMRESGEECGWLGTSGDASSDSLMGLAEQQVSQALASQGGIGLARLITRGFKEG